MPRKRSNPDTTTSTDNADDTAPDTTTDTPTTSTVTVDQFRDTIAALAPDVDGRSGLTDKQTATIADAIGAMHPSARSHANSAASSAAVSADVSPAVIGQILSAVVGAVDAARSTAGNGRTAGPTQQDRRDGLTSALVTLAAAMVAAANVDGLDDADRIAVLSARPDLLALVEPIGAVSGQNDVPAATVARYTPSVVNQRTTIGRTLAGIPDGTTVTFHGVTATVRGGELSVPKHGRFASPSPAAAAVRPTTDSGKPASYNGWTVWTGADGRTLADIHDA